MGRFGHPVVTLDRHAGRKARALMPHAVAQPSLVDQLIEVEIEPQGVGEGQGPDQLAAPHATAGNPPQRCQQVRGGLGHAQPQVAYGEGIFFWRVLLESGEWSQ